jgi:hypothetical protein
MIGAPSSSQLFSLWRLGIPPSLLVCLDLWRSPELGLESRRSQAPPLQLTAPSWAACWMHANPALHKLQIHDNLSSHKSLEVLEAVRRRGHRVVCRPPYRPQDGPVEFAINQVCCRLVKRWSEVSDLQTMQTVIQHIINTEINGMDATFLKCGYIW